MSYHPKIDNVPIYFTLPQIFDNSIATYIELFSSKVSTIK